MKLSLTITRWLVGLLFIFSGLIKANDPMGLSYKMQEFFEVWGLHGLNDYTLVLSVLIIAFEIIAGMAVIVGWQFRLFSWLLLMLILFFTFLTAYALFSGKIKECGCFGDCIKLTAFDSFVKDIILSVLIIYLFIYRHNVRSLLGNSLSVLVMILTMSASFAGQFYVLKHLPVIDCLPYKVGSHIPTLRKIPAGAIPDSVVITFVYKKENATVEFDADHFPSDFNDSTYTFVNRYDKVVRKGNAEPLIKDFVLVDENNMDVTENILANEGEILILFTKSWNSEWMEAVALIENAAKAKQIPLMVATSAPEAVRNSVSLPVFKSDFVAVKTAARVDPTIYWLKAGTIQGKWSLADHRKLIDRLN